MAMVKLVGRVVLFGLGGLALLLCLAVALLYTPSMNKATVMARHNTAASNFLPLAGGGTVHFQDEGAPDGRPLVLLHGSQSHALSWDPLVAELPDYRVISIDLPGHGLTGALPDGRYNREEAVAVILAVLAHLQIDRAALAGSSRGGAIAALFAQRHPDRTAALILIDASGLRLPLTEAERDEAGDGTPLGWKLAAIPGVRQLLTKLTPRFLIAQGLQAAVADPAALTKDQIDAYWHMLRYDGNRAATLQQFMDRTPRAEIDHAGLALPALVLWGAQDALIPLRVAYAWHARLPDSRLVIYHDTGHLPAEEVPARTAAEIQTFLTRIGWR